MQINTIRIHLYLEYRERRTFKSHFHETRFSIHPYKNQDTTKSVQNLSK